VIFAGFHLHQQFAAALDGARLRPENLSDIRRT
jgi:hypothetical protein